MRIIITEAAKSLAACIASVKVGNIVMISGKAAISSGDVSIQGRAGEDLTKEQGKERDDTFSAHVFKSGYDIRAVQELLGHKDVKTTMNGGSAMSSHLKAVWLRRVLAAKAILTLLVWGLPALIAPLSVLRLLGVPTPDDPLFVRLFGAVVTAFGVAYYYAYRDPVRNAAIVRVGIIDNALITLTILVFILFLGLKSFFMWASALLTLGFCVSFILLAPRSEPA